MLKAKQLDNTATDGALCVRSSPVYSPHTLNTPPWSRLVGNKVHIYSFTFLWDFIFSFTFLWDFIYSFTFLWDFNIQSPISGPPIWVCHWVTALTLVRPIFILSGWDFKALSLPLMREGFSGTQFVRFSQNLLTFPSNILHGSPQSLVLMTNGLCPQPALSRLPRGTTGHNTFYTEYQEKNNNWRP